jgi:hypothetical protein
MHQYHCYGVGYLIAAIPGIRQWTIEPSAYGVQEAAETLLFK